MPAENKIFLTDEYLQADGEANEAITPGHLIEYDTSTELYKKHATDDGIGIMPLFARKAPYAGTEDADGTIPIDVAYAQGDQCYAGIALRGARVNALIKANEDIAVGDKLVSAGDGTLRELQTGTSPDDTNGCLAVAREAGTDTSAFRLIVEVL